MNHQLSSSAIGSTTLRPRNRRRTDDEADHDHLTGPLPTPRVSSSPSVAASSRNVSPVPNIEPLRAAASGLGTNTWNPFTSGPFLSVPEVPSVRHSPSTPNLWGTSWTSIRGLASDLFVGGSSRDPSPGASPSRWRSHNRPTPKYPRSSSQWGLAVAPPKDLASGTRERQRAEAEARKRERLLIGDDDGLRDGLGKFKRRGSFDLKSNALDQSEDPEQEALIYVHKVRPGDTLAGVMIKYNCQAQIFRKANRFWPNDSIQSRKVVVLPVDACSIKGKRIADSEATAISEERASSSGNCGSQGNHSGDSSTKLGKSTTPISSGCTSPSLSAATADTGELPYRHDAWVVVDGFEDPIEIARMSKKTLGYFPRARRKSQSYSDLGTPSASLDLSRASFQSEPTVSPLRSRSNSNSYFANLNGPGGVGSMSKNVRSPGPAHDGLNRLFPSMEHTMAPRMAGLLSDSSVMHQRGLESVGGSLEGWVRKLASRASSTMHSPAITGGASSGDLIELSEEAFELGEPVERSGAQGRGRAFSRPGDQQAIDSVDDGFLDQSFSAKGRIFTSSNDRRG